MDDKTSLPRSHEFQTFTRQDSAKKSAQKNRDSRRRIFNLLEENKEITQWKCYDVMKDLQEILTSLGAWCAYKAAKLFYRALEKYGRGRFNKIDTLWIEMCCTQLRLIEAVFEDFANTEFNGIHNLILVEPLITPKALKLLDILRENKSELCSIIFVQRRVTAVVLSELINDAVKLEHETYDGIWSEYVLGHNMGETLKLSDVNMQSKQQERILAKFHQSEFNVLVSTSVVEEGLDVRKCNLVVRFDGVNNYREYVQSKGRARAQKSQFVVLVEDKRKNETELDLEVMRAIESLLHEKCQDRDEPTEEEINSYINEEEQFLPPYVLGEREGAPRITSANCISLLHMYCSKLKADKYTVAKPVCKIFKVNEEMYQAKVEMPINSPLKEKIDGDTMPEKTLAKKSAAMKACIRLYEIGELNEHFLPRDNEAEPDSDDEKKDPAAKKEGTKKQKKIYPRKLPDCYNVPGPFPLSGLFVYSLTMRLTDPRDDSKSIPLWKIWYEENRGGFGIITAEELPLVPPFPLYTKAGKVIVTIQPVCRDMTISVENFDDLLNFHKETLNRFAEPFTAGRVVDIEIAKQKLLVVPLRHDIVDQLSKGLSNDLYHLPISSVVDCDCLRNDQSSNRFLLASYLAEIPDAENIYQDAVVSTPYREEKTQNYYVIKVRRDIGPSSSMCSDGLTDDDKQALTYSQYYELKYGKRISLDQPLLESVMASKRINCLTPRYDNDDDEPPRKRRKTGDRLKVNLIPELCPVDPFPSSLFCQAVCLPSALFRLETILLAEELRRRISVEAQLTKVPEVQVNQIQTISEDSYIIPEYKACSSKCNESKEKHAYMKTESKMISLSFVGSPSNAHEPQSNSLRSDATEFVDLAILMSSTPRGSRSSTPSIATILRVLTTTKANAGFDLERLEMLGDSFLKQAVSIFLYFHYPNDDEGKLSRKRRQQISNKTLRKHSLKKDLEAILCNTAFGAGRRNDESDTFDRCRRLWLPPFYCLKKNSEDGFKDAEKLDLADINDNEHQIASNYVDTLGTASGNDAKHLCGSIDSCVVEAPSQIISDKCLADSVEALIGAYLEFGGCEVALRVMKWLEIDCYSEEEIGKSKSYYSNFSKPLSGLIEPSNYNHRRSLDKLYHREKFDQLEEKIQYNFQDKSHLVQAFTHMSYSHNRYTECYQRLEFLGDALLDFLVTFYLYNNYKNLSPGRLTDLRQALVNNNTFGLLTVKYGFHKYLMCLSPALFSALGQFVQRVENEDETIDVLLKNTFVIILKDDEEGYHAPKALGDIFESLAGAIFIDSNLDLVEVWKVFYPMLKPLIDIYVKEVPLNPVRELQELHPEAEFSFDHESEEPNIKCMIKVQGTEFIGIGQNKATAKATAARRALLETEKPLS